jgi:hypothetical protein
MAFGWDDAIGLGIGGISSVLNIFGAGQQRAAEEAAYKQQQQNYKDAKKFQRANDRFAAWQSRFNAKLSNTNSKYQYWAATVNYNQQKSYVNSLRNYETIRAIRQAETVAETRANAMAAYVADSQAISNAYQEADIQDAFGRMQYRWRALQARASVQALEQEGNSVDRVINDYSRQLGDYETLQNINAGLRKRQYTREQAAQVAQYLSRYNSQKFYDEQPYMDPLPPLAPLPTLVMPPAPSMTGAPPTRPSGAAMGLNIATGVLNGVQAGVSAWQGLRGLSTPSGGGSGTGSGLDLSGIRQYGG